MARPRKTGERHPGGKLVQRKPDVEPISGALWQRLKQHGKTFGLDARITTELGRLNWFGELTVAQTAAGFRVAEIYGRYERYKRLRRWAKSPSYDATYGEAGAAEELLGETAFEELQTRHRVATEAFERLVGLAEFRFYDKKTGVCIRPAIPGLIPASLRQPIEALCVEDRSINPTCYDDVRECLQSLAVSFKISGAPAAQASKGSASASRHGPALHFNKHEDIAGTTTAPAAKRPNLDRIFWIQVSRKIAPHLDIEQLGAAYDIMQALKAREIFRRSKERKAGNNVVPFDPK